MPSSFRQIIGASPSTVSASSGNTALLVIDAQGTYATGSPLAITGVEQAQTVIGELVEKYRKVSEVNQFEQSCARTAEISTAPPFFLRPAHL